MEDTISVMTQPILVRQESNEEEEESGSKLLLPLSINGGHSTHSSKEDNSEMMIDKLLKKWTKPRPQTCTGKHVTLFTINWDSVIEWFWFVFKRIIGPIWIKRQNRTKCIDLNICLFCHFFVFWTLKFTFYLNISVWKIQDSIRQIVMRRSNDPALSPDIV